MNSYQKRVWFFAAGLSALAGYVDAIGFLTIGGYFISFMSGNSTRLSVGLAQDMSQAFIAGTLIAVFVLGVVLGTVAGHVAKAKRRPAILSLVALLLALASACGALGHKQIAIILMGLAMGAENTVFERDGEVHVGLTYMTGTLVKFGQRLTSALLGRNRFEWVPYLLLWLGLAFGAFLGAEVFPLLGLGGLWIAAGAAAILSAISASVEKVL